MSRSLPLLFAVLWVAAVGAIEPARPNVVLILADDLGIHDLGCYRRKEHPTPHLDRLASQGMRFTSAYCAQPICSPSRAAILTGKTPARLHLTTFLPGRANAPSQRLLHPAIQPHLPLEERTLAEELRDAGYATACIGKWHLGGAKFDPKSQGFDVVHVGKANTPPSATEGGKGEFDLTAAAEQFIEQQRDRPFFLYLPHNTPHIPLAARPELIEKHRAAFHPTYAAMMESMDECVGRVLRKLETLGLADRTMVLFTSDNGGLHVLEFAGTPATHNTPYRAGKGFLYEGGLRVPLIVRWPGRIPAGKVTELPIVNTDFMPTLLELCGVRVGSRFDGVSFAKLLTTGEQGPRTFFWHFPHYTNQGSQPAGAVRDGDWKLIEHYADGRTELFNLRDDVSETNDLAAQHPDRVRAMKEQLGNWRRSVGAQENAINPAFDPELHRQLYVDVDPSRLVPQATAEKTAQAWQEWRRRMNAVIAKP